MKKIMPDFHGEFACIGGACTDNCCIGWEIDIDRATMAKYQAMEGEFGEKLRSGIEGEPPHFKLTENERCVMLNEDNLCRIILQGGEEMLCEICDQHPRFRAQYGERLEIGAGICCEVAARQWLTGSGRLKLTEREISGKPPRMTKEQAARLEALIPLRERMFDIMASDAPLNGRMAQVLLLADGAQKALDAGRPKRIASLTAEPMPGSGTAAELDDACVTLLARMEPIDRKWTEYLARLREQMPQVRAAQAEFEAAAPRENAYARLMAYGLYRYMLKGVGDGDVLSRVKWAALNVHTVRRMDALNWLASGKAWSDAHEIEAAKLLSKQVEYSQENMTLMLSECWNSMMLSTERIIGGIMG